MNKVLLLLLVAGLVAGVFFIGSNLTGTQNLPPEDTEEPSAEKALPDQETETTYEPEPRATVSSDLKTLDFKVDVTRENEDYTYRYRVQNPGTENENLRIDSVREDGAEMTIILRESTDEGWVKDFSSNEWTYFTGIAFTQMWRTRSEQYLAYRVSEWNEMEGQTFTVDAEGGTARVYNIKVNKGISNSVFSPS